MGKEFHDLDNGDRSDKRSFSEITTIFQADGIDTVSFECSICAVMPGSGALTNRRPGVIKSRKILRIPWDEIPELYFKTYSVF